MSTETTLVAPFAGTVVSVPHAPRGLVSLVGIASGYCFAGNAALLGCCDVIVATEDASIGMGGPAMIEGGGLGSYHPSEVGPIDVQYANGVVDRRVADDATAVTAARRYLSYFRRTPPEPTSETAASDQTQAIEDPLERQQAYDEAVAAAYERGRGISMASYFEIDDVIDPADTRRWIATPFDDGVPHWSRQPGKRRPFVAY